ncbi:MAG: N-acetylglucosaminyldiphosphoundecaprenol N-acetyl-beta-D-mannosaminyltransferase [Verrucomicrobiales bacterium]|jgi:N-acetylglucosaminyldiphosphoundecaprenol N-acetyl-beta-D-mannosaminyltransferase
MSVIGNPVPARPVSSSLKETPLAVSSALPESHAFGIGFSAISAPEFFRQLGNRIRARDPQYVVTPNLDFARIASHTPAFHRALKNASLRLCDGAILYHLLKLKGRPVPEKLSGSDLTPQILQYAVDQGFTVYLFGSDEQTLKKVQQRYGDAIVGWDAPPYRKDLSENDKLNQPYIDRIRALQPDIVLVALGAPKQELWAQNYHRACAAPMTLCIGASLDFISNKARRSPKIFSALCMEWVWRLAMEPGRLWRRYLSDAVFLITHFSKC